MKELTNQLRITEIFHSLQGESVRVGLPSVFVRLTGCPLRCQYCDTAYAFKGGDLMNLEQILELIKSYSCEYVCVTGGEPLAQPNCIKLLKNLCDAKFKVSIETSGALSIAEVDKRVMVVLDLKTPGSGEVDKNLLSNLKYLKPNDQIKFVICSQDDYQWACKMITEHRLFEIADLLFSPSFGQINPTLLADWIIKDKIPVRFQLQLHKILWNDSPGH